MVNLIILRQADSLPMLAGFKLASGRVWKYIRPPSSKQLLHLKTMDFQNLLWELMTFSEKSTGFRVGKYIQLNTLGL